MADTKISALTGKTTPIAADTSVIVDSADGLNKSILLGNLPLTGNRELKALATGLLKNTTTTGTPSIAVEITDYFPPLDPTGKANYMIRVNATADDFELVQVPVASAVATEFLDGTGDYRAIAATDLPDISLGTVLEVFTAKNGEAGAMAIGDAVYVMDGTTNTVPTVGFAKADSTASNKFPVAGVLQDATLAAGATGTFIVKGVLTNTAWSELTIGGGESGLVWVSITGTTGNTLTQTKPDNLRLLVGTVVNDAYSADNTGKSKSIFVNITPFWAAP